MAYSRLDTGSSSEKLEDQRRAVEKKSTLQNGDPEDFSVTITPSERHVFSHVD
jgi:hypothetical protein